MFAAAGEHLRDKRCRLLPEARPNRKRFKRKYRQAVRVHGGTVIAAFIRGMQYRETNAWKEV